MKQRALAVVSAGLSQPSSTRLLADQLATATALDLRARDVQVESRAIDLREHAHDVINHLITGFPSPGLKQVIDMVTGSDALIAVTPIFNASYNGLFKSFFDTIGDTSLVDKPILIGATGGTSRHSLALEHALRPMFVYLQAVVVPTSVFAGPEDWAGGSTEASLRRRIERAARELADQIQRREPVSAADPFNLTTSFEQLLAGE